MLQNILQSLIIFTTTPLNSTPFALTSLREEALPDPQTRMSVLFRKRDGVYSKGIVRSLWLQVSSDATRTLNFVQGISQSPEL